ncbi:hypothetical protein M0813_16857 [Anaeramoeba flamelloides]|uniref:LOV domain-containing protein n=1 Tax=Anaeramoeba flamelloides TaxID=1746091 RepID=A0ABQ8YXR4_9EUKA|nr:hypothetical protein M0813_16857 [Anaeramoeba flamelloides]
MGLKYSSYKQLQYIPQRNRQKFLELIDNSPLPMALFDYQGKHEFVNKSLLDLLHVDDPKHSLGKTPSEIHKTSSSPYSKFQPYNNQQSSSVLPQIHEEIRKNNTCELIFLYEIKEPKINKILVKLLVRRIRIGRKKHTLTTSILLTEKPLKNPFENRIFKKKNIPELFLPFEIEKKCAFFKPLTNESSEEESNIQNTLKLNEKSSRTSESETSNFSDVLREILPSTQILNKFFDDFQNQQDSDQKKIEEDGKENKETPNIETIFL